ncbi:MAG: SapC family protein [Gammaproteobacteria bacterium]|nr:SapC family protein [Gammaproteobacteria bacterium]MDJ0872047.1 SapC family protein [Gammaproteobacteria bacterium]MDJ0890270.1 SapC family protein [Gammaproteobacteria bacterium]
MSTQLLIYERAVQVNKNRHLEWSVKTGTDYAFVRHVNSVPLMAVEFPNAATEYAIVFAGTEEAVMPTIILGVHDKENLYVTEAGGWEAKYIPAFVRRYPFVFSSSDDGKTFMLCIDEEYAGCNQDGRGERLFDAEGERTQYLEGVLKFLKDYQAQFRRTQIFCDKLKKLDLLEPMQAQFTLGTTGEHTSLSGFMAVKRERLKALSGEQLSELAQSDELELVYLHLQSMHNLSVVAQRAATQAQEAEVKPQTGSAVAANGKNQSGDDGEPDEGNASPGESLH